MKIKDRFVLPLEWSIAVICASLSLLALWIVPATNGQTPPTSFDFTKTAASGSGADSLRAAPSVAVGKLPTFSAQPTLGEISSCRLFAQPLLPIGAMAPSAGEKRALVHALSVYSGSDSNPENTTSYEQFLNAYPQSVFRVALLTNLGLIYRHNGYWSKALTAWQQAWQAGKDEADPNKRLVVDQALAQLAELTARLGRIDDLKALIADAGDRAVRGPAAEKYGSAKVSLFLMQNSPTKSYRCGPYAVGTVFRALHPDRLLKGEVHDSISTDHGTSLMMVQDFAKRLGLNYQMAFRGPGAAVLVPSVVNWKVGHYAAVTRELNGRYLVEDPTFTDSFAVSKQALDQEGSGYYLVPTGTLPEGWRTVSNDEGQKIWGRGAVTPNTPPIPPSRGPCPGMPSYDFDKSRVNLFINDTPYFYELPRGPEMEFTVSYSQRDSSPISLNMYSNMGPQWNFNWVAYIVDDPQNAATTSYGPGGGILKYAGYDGATGRFVPQTETRTVLQRLSPSGYLRTSPDGSKQIFGQGYTISGTTYYFMTESDDPAGNKVIFTYDPTYCRLNSVTDTLGQQINLSYVNSTDPTTGDYYRVSQVADQTGRHATFTYNSLGQLFQITDMAGMTSHFTYDASDAIIKMTTPYGDTTFASTDYPNSDRSLIITDPEGAKEQVMFRFNGDAPDATAAYPLAPGLIVDTYAGERNSYYWNKKAFSVGAGDYSKAHAYRWFEVPGGGACSDILSSEKPALESRIYYNYLNQQDVYILGNSGLPIIQARLLDDGSTQAFRYDYNGQGRIQKIVDPSTPARVTTFQYAPNGIDLTAVYQQNPAGASSDGYGQPADLLRSSIYDTQGKHLVVQSSDAAGQHTGYTYNSFGQVLTVTNAKNETTTFTYDRNQAHVGGQTDGYLTTVNAPVAGATTHYGYDGYGRLSQTTDSEGYVVVTGYDSLNRVTMRTYPDSTYEEVDYDRMEPQWTRDRLGRWTELLHDELRHLTGVIDPMNRLTQYEWCNCGALEAIIDASGNKTTWMRDVESRVTSKIYPDTSVWSTVYENSTSRVHSTTDAKGQQTLYLYNIDGSLQQVNYTVPSGYPPTPNVSYTYDPVYLRIASMSDGIGPTPTASPVATQYNYNTITNPPTLGAGRLYSVAGPFANSTITFGYDELGRVNQQSINGNANSSAFSYDSLGRLQTVHNPLSVNSPAEQFTYNYLRNTARLNSVAMPYGQTTQYSYFNGTSDPRLQTISNMNSSGGVISQFDYTYSAVGDILSWTQNNSSLTHPQQYQFGFDSDSEITSATLQDTASGNILSEQAYSYDAAMNRISVQNGNSVTTEKSNNLNQITQTSGGGLMRFAGTVSKPSTITVGGNTATVRADNSYEGWAQVNVTGTTQVHIVATDSSSNVTDKSASVNPGSVTAQYFSYDSNGNQTAAGPSGSQVTYGWDAADRLISVTQGNNTSQFDYDGQSRRVRERLNGTTIKQWIWIGMSLVEERDANNNVTKRFFAQGEQIGSQSYFYMRDHLGSVRELVDNTNAIRARYNYDPYGLRSLNLITTNPVEADFGFTGHYFHQSSGLHLAAYRAYSTAFSRWLSEDPLGITSGGINVYSYCSNEPLKYVDPKGLQGFNFGPVGPAGSLPGTIPGPGQQIPFDPSHPYAYPGFDPNAGNNYINGLVQSNTEAAILASGSIAIIGIGALAAITSPADAAIAAGVALEPVTTVCIKRAFNNGAGPGPIGIIGAAWAWYNSTFGSPFVGPPTPYHPDGPYNFQP